MIFDKIDIDYYMANFQIKATAARDVLVSCSLTLSVRELEDILSPYSLTSIVRELEGTKIIKIEIITIIK